MNKISYKQWRRGDILRVISVDELDPFKVGDIVVHRDNDGDDAPFVSIGMNGHEWAIPHEQLEFVGHDGTEYDVLLNEYGAEINVPELTMGELIASHRRLRTRNKRESKPKYNGKQTPSTYVKVSELRKMTIEEIFELIK